MQRVQNMMRRWQCMTIRAFPWVKHCSYTCAAQTMTMPATGGPVQLRIGMHTVRNAVSKNEESQCVEEPSSRICAHVLMWVAAITKLSKISDAVLRCMLRIQAREVGLLECCSNFRVKFLHDICLLRHVALIFVPSNR